MMNFLLKRFIPKKGDKPLSTSQAIQNLRETEEMLFKKQDYLERKIEMELNIARTNRTKDTRAAIQALRKKKRYEQQLRQTDGALSQVEMQREALEGATTNTAILKTMKAASDTLKTVQKNMNIDQVHNIMDNIAEQQDVAREMTEAISNAIGANDDFDLDELEKELEELEQEDLDNQLLGVSVPTIVLPPPQVDIPASQPTSSKAGSKVSADEDEDLAKLVAWAS